MNRKLCWNAEWRAATEMVLAGGGGWWLGGDPESVCLIPRANPVNVQLYEALYLTRYVQLASLLLNR